VQLKLNTDESPNVATEYGIRSIPTVMVFKNGGWVGAAVRAARRWVGCGLAIRAWIMFALPGLLPVALAAYV
jgi:hypothetical protein